MFEEKKESEILVEGKIPQAVKRPKLLWLICVSNVFYILLTYSIFKRYFFAGSNPKGLLAGIIILILLFSVIYFIKGVFNLKRISLHISSALFAFMMLLGVSSAVQGSVTGFLLLFFPPAFCIFYINKKSFLYLAKEFREYENYKEKYFPKKI